VSDVVDEPSAEESVEDIELELLLEALWRKYGVDFRRYARASMGRRVRVAMENERVPSISALQDRVLRDPDCFARTMSALSVTVTSMFRDPTFFASFRQNVVPYLRGYPFTRVWHAGCSTGEEVYSLAILLAEEGLLEKARIYATDMNPVAIEAAKQGIYPLERMQEYATNYLRAGGTGSLSDYFTASYEHAIFRTSLRKNVVFSQHDLALDRSFNEFNVIFCRNVLIYFDPALQTRAHELFQQSLRRFGVLCLGKGETVRHTPFEHAYEVVDDKERIYKRRAE
jgi:chemotaxis protein methyltransferase CheR